MSYKSISRGFLSMEVEAKLFWPTFFSCEILLITRFGFIGQSKKKPINSYLFRVSELYCTFWCAVRYRSMGVRYRVFGHAFLMDVLEFHSSCLQVTKPYDRSYKRFLVVDGWIDELMD
jgi:hypothetical protein